jgi:hypothetical protein
MRFQIDSDTGSSIVGWLAPDNPTVTPRVRVVMDDGQRLIVEGKHRRPGIKERGLHNTGLCGFVLDERNCRGVASARALQIYDEDTNILVYQRRRTNELVDQRLFRLETQMLRLSPLNDLLVPLFHMPYLSLDLLGKDTVEGILAIAFTSSLLATGALYYRAHEYQIRERGFRTAILLRDPYEELAERLLILKWSGTPEGAATSPCLGKGVSGAIKAMRDAEFGTADDIAALLKKLDEPARRVLFNTTTRLLACQAIDDPLDDNAVGSALDTLSEFNAVGVRENVRGFLDILEAVIGLDGQLPDITLPVYPSVRGLAGRLRDVPAIGERIALDVQVHSAVLKAMGSVSGRAVQDATPGAEPRIERGQA